MGAAGLAGGPDKAWRPKHQCSSPVRSGTIPAIQIQSRRTMDAGEDDGDLHRNLQHDPDA
jgi:hypothetical protein